MKILCPARYADIVAVDGDPLQDVTTLERMNFVVKGGKVKMGEDGRLIGTLELRYNIALFD